MLQDVKLSEFLRHLAGIPACSGGARKKARGCATIPNTAPCGEPAHYNRKIERT